MKKRGQRKKKIPLGVKIISILYFFIAALVVISGIVIISLGISSMGSDVGGIIAILAISLVVALIPISIARGLWKGKGWAKNIVIFFSVLGALGAITSLFEEGIIDIILNIHLLAVNGSIAYYLYFNKKAKKFFLK